MASIGNQLDRAQARARDTDWLDTAGRIGYATKGVVYMVIGVLALMTAFGSGGETTGSSGALVALKNQPFGLVMVWAAGIGLSLYAVWRVFEAFADPSNEGTDAEGVVKRIGYFVSATIHGFLAYNAFSLATGDGGGSKGGGGAESWSAQLMSEPFGQILLGAVGVVIVGVALKQLKMAYTADFMEDNYDRSLNGDTREWVERLGRIGYGARGVVFSIVGGFVAYAAATADPDKAEGFGGALTTLQQQPYGWILLGAVAIGLLGYAAHCGARAKYGRFHTD